MTIVKLIFEQPLGLEKVQLPCFVSWSEANLWLVTGLLFTTWFRIMVYHILDKSSDFVSLQHLPLQFDLTRTFCVGLIDLLRQAVSILVKI